MYFPLYLLKVVILDCRWERISLGMIQIQNLQPLIASSEFCVPLQLTLDKSKNRIIRFPGGKELHQDIIFILVRERGRGGYCIPPLRENMPGTWIILNCRCERICLGIGNQSDIYTGGSNSTYGGNWDVKMHMQCKKRRVDLEWSRAEQGKTYRRLGWRYRRIGLSRVQYRVIYQ